MHKTHYSPRRFLRNIIETTLGAGLSLLLLSSGCDKGSDKGSDAKGDKDNTDKNSGGDSDEQDSATGNDGEPSDAKLARVVKICKKACEREEVLECEDNGFSDKEDDCIKDCNTQLSTYYRASEDEACLDAMDDTFNCLYGLDCDDFPEMSGQMTGLLSTDTEFTGDCSDQFEKTAEHCADDIKKAFGGLGGGPTKPAPKVIDIVMNESKWSDSKATITENDEGDHKVVISKNNDLECGQDESRLESAITLTVKASASATTSVSFHYGESTEVIENANVSITPESNGERTVSTQAISKDGKFSVVGAIAAKVCE